MQRYEFKSSMESFKEFSGIQMRIRGTKLIRMDILFVCSHGCIYLKSNRCLPLSVVPPGQPGQFVIQTASGARFIQSQQGLPGTVLVAAPSNTTTPTGQNLTTKSVSPSIVLFGIKTVIFGVLISYFCYLWNSLSAMSIMKTNMTLKEMQN